MEHKSVVPRIIMINVIIFFLWNFYGVINPDFMINNFLVSWSQVTSGRIWTLITTVFSHNMLWHLLINMFVLYNFGVVVEMYLGTKRFLRFYLLSGLAGSLGHCLVSAYMLDQPALAALGASGAISGIVLFFALVFPNEKIFIFGLIPMPAIWAAILFAGIDAWGLINQTQGSASLIGHGAHLGGALAGLLYYLGTHRIRHRGLRRT